MKNLLTTLFFCIALNMVIAQSQSRSVPIDLDEGTNARTQVISMDLIVQGSECVGVDCSNSVSFGFDTEILRENNLRVLFDDTSNSASFPKNDWRLTANDSSNGGDSYFSIDDATAGRQVFRVDAGAPANSLRVKNSGNVGIGTATPVVELQVTDGDSPTLRLEQNGSSGFTAQTWDIAGNETNFFVRDVTNGSKLPFKIKPNAPTSSIFVAASGNIGLGTESPGAELHVNATDASETEVHIQNTNGTTQSVGLRMINTSREWNYQLRNNGNWRIRNVTGMVDALEIDGATNAITTAGDITANGVMLTSDLRLKQDVEPYTEGISVLKQLNPISYKFNGKAGFKSERTYYSVGAQELKEAAPYLVHDFTYENENDEGKVTSQENYLKIDIAGITWTLVNAVKEQQEELEEKDREIIELKEELSSIKNQIEALSNAIENFEEQDVYLKGGQTPSIGQNIPNPYQSETKIDYFIPEHSNSAKVNFFDLSGKLLKEVTLTDRGNGRLNLKTLNLPSGTYTYSLIVDQQVFDSKKMIVE